MRNLNKKLKEIQHLEAERKDGKELKEGQLAKITSKDDHNTKRKELETVAKLYLEARAESLLEKKDTPTTTSDVSPQTVSSIS